MSKKPLKIYAVKVGRIKGIFFAWSDCETQVKGFSGAEHKSFPKSRQGLLDAGLFLFLGVDVDQAVPESKLIKNEEYDSDIEGCPF